MVSGWQLPLHARNLSSSAIPHSQAKSQLQNEQDVSPSSKKPKTGVLMLNMGGPQTTDEVGEYLLRIMTDRDMIQLPVQGWVFLIYI